VADVEFLTVDHVSVRFGGVQALAAVSFSVNEGEIFGLIGPNGAGKTTLFNCISGLAQPDEGHIRFCGTSLGGVPVHRRSLLGIARTFQNLNLFGKLSVLENLMIPVEVRQRRGFIADAFHAASSTFGEQQARERAHAILHLLGLAEQTDVLAADLPVGLQRRVEIGRALAQRPRLLLLDEPASGLDARETAELGALLPVIRHRLNITIVLVDHDMALVMRVCDRIAAMDFGVIMTIDTPAEVRADERVIAAYLGQAAARQDAS
jgi:branched-chain amino acid transport system ATP-binding protein